MRKQTKKFREALNLGVPILVEIFSNLPPVRFEAFGRDALSKADIFGPCLILPELVRP